MKVSLKLLRVDIDDVSHYRIVVHKVYGSGDGRAGIDPRAMAAAFFGTIASNVTIIREWADFDFDKRGGMLIDPADFADAMADDHEDIAGAVDAARAWLSMFSIPYIKGMDARSEDPIPDGAPRGDVP